MEALSGDLPPAYCSLYRPENSDNSSDTITTPLVIASDIDGDPLVAPSFQHKFTRNVFIQKVLAIRCLQLIAGFGIIVVVYNIFGDIEFELRRNTLYYWVLLWPLMHIAIQILLLIWKDAEIKSPYNFFFLVTKAVNTPLVLLVITNGFLSLKSEFFFAWIFYVVLTMALLVYTMLLLDTTLEFKVRDASLLTAGLSILMFGIVTYFLRYGPYNIYALFYMTLLFFLVCAYAAYRAQVITSGEYRRPLTPADFISAALYSEIDFLLDFVKLVTNLPRYVTSQTSEETES